MQTATKLQKAQAAMAARKTSFPVLVLDGSVKEDGDAFRATLYGADFQPIGEPMTQTEIKAGQHFMHRMLTRAEFEAEKARSQGAA